MNFEMRCECGVYHSLSEGDAGVSLNCACGRTVVVPSLGELRKREGLPAHSPPAILVIENMLDHGELPTVPTCSVCVVPTDTVTYVTAECEQTWNNSPNPLTRAIGLLFLGIWAFVLQPADRTEQGRNLVLHLPFRICVPCHQQLLRRSRGTILLVAAPLLAVLALPCLFLGEGWAWGLMGLALLALLIGLKLRKRWRSSIKGVLGHEPIYRQLIGDYPDANYLIDE